MLKSPGIKEVFGFGTERKRIVKFIKARVAAEEKS